MFTTVAAWAALLVVTAELRSQRAGWSVHQRTADVRAGHKHFTAHLHTLMLHTPLPWGGPHLPYLVGGGVERERKSGGERDRERKERVLVYEIQTERGKEREYWCMRSRERESEIESSGV